MIQLCCSMEVFTTLYLCKNYNLFSWQINIYKIDVLSYIRLFEDGCNTSSTKMVEVNTNNHNQMWRIIIVCLSIFYFIRVEINKNNHNLWIWKWTNEWNAMKIFHCLRQSILSYLARDQHKQSSLIKQYTIIHLCNLRLLSLTIVLQKIHYYKLYSNMYKYDKHTGKHINLVQESSEMHITLMRVQHFTTILKWIHESMKEKLLHALLDLYQRYTEGVCKFLSLVHCKQTEYSLLEDSLHENSGWR